MKLQRVENTKVLMNINEANEETAEVSVEEAPVSVEEEPKTEVAEEPAVEVEAPVEETQAEKDQVVVSFSESLNTLTQNYWNNISFIKSIIVMLKEQEVPFEKDNVINILNTLSDDMTIGVGMLAKASELIDDSTKKLMDVGTEKAEIIISEPASTDLE